MILEIPSDMEVVVVLFGRGENVGPFIDGGEL